MATKTQTATANDIPQTATDTAQNTAKPRKKRTPGVKYTNIVNSAYVQKNGEMPTNPLDQLALTSKGGLKFPGVVFETSIMGVIVKIPGRQTAIKNPTVRQIFKVLDELYAS